MGKGKREGGREREREGKKKEYSLAIKHSGGGCSQAM